MCNASGKFLGLLPCNSLGTKGIGLDLAYQVSLRKSRSINNNQIPLMNGDWNSILHIGSLSLRANF